MTAPEERPRTPIESRSYGTLYILFSGILMLATAWAVWDEAKVRRPWKDYESEFVRLLAARLDSAATAASAGIDSSQAAALKQQLSEAESGLRSNEYVLATNEKDRLARELDIATREWRFARSRSDAAYYQYKKSLEEGGNWKVPKATLERHDADVARFFREKTDLESRIAVQDTLINRSNDAVRKATAGLKALYAQVSSFSAKAEKTRSAPITVHQVILNDFELTPFQEIKSRVDRCQTCHLGWKEDLMADAPQPFAKHPYPELLARHNPETFGCTPCHRGQGPALTAGFAHGNEDRYWETPILKGDDVYASCNSCHYNESVLKYARPFTRAKQLVIESGCYGCHEIKGFSDLTRIGPPLNALIAKTVPTWVYRWVKNPKEYNPHTRMPNFRFDDAQAQAITAYLLSVSQRSDFRYLRPRGSFGGGSVAEGKKLFETVGCQACHVIGEFETVRNSRSTSFDMAPELTRVGSKVNGDWLYDWLKNPRHYNPDTRMPSLRLLDSEARNLTAYLLSLKDPRSLAGDGMDFTSETLVKRGDKLVREYGCAGCHVINGMEKEGKVSVELSDFGRKKVEQMDFGDTRELEPRDSADVRMRQDGTVSVRRTWGGWVFGKLRNSRQFATDRIQQKMPVFAFNDEEIRLLRLFLTSMTKDVPLVRYENAFDKRMQDVEAGRRLTMKYNCIQCHNVEDRGGYILARFEEPAMGPPLLPESEGAKVQESWLHGFLQNPTTIRPWLKIRMPSFSLTDDEISVVQKYFLGMSKQEFVLRDYSAIPVDERMMSPGRQLFGTYQCGKCHPSGASAAGTVASDLAPNLALAHSRLKPNWIIDWLHDPQKLQPGTRMPTFFYEGQAPDQTVLGGKADDQIQALRAYVWSLGKKTSAVVSSR